MKRTDSELLSAPGGFGLTTGEPIPGENDETKKLVDEFQKVQQTHGIFVGQAFVKLYHIIVGAGAYPGVYLLPTY